MADQDYLHTAEIMKAALPYIDTRSRGFVEIITKFLDLMASLKAAAYNMAACGYQESKTDMEGMLNGIRPLCNNREREFIDRILSFFNMKRMMETYNNIMSAMKTMQEFDGFNFTDGDSGFNADNIAGNFSGSNFESIFNSFQSSFNTDTEAKVDDYNDFPSGNETQAAENIEADYSDQKNSDSSYTENKGNGMNPKMLDMLKAMVPPEQRSTFENLSMLLNTMSYDNNSKPDHSKEQSDG